MIAAATTAGCDAASAARSEGKPPPGTATSTTGARGTRAKSRKPPSPVAVAAAQKGSISSFYVTTTTLEPEKTAPVLARVTGVVQKILVEEGDTVRANQLMLRIERSQYELEVAKLAAKTAQLKDSYKRLKRMVARQLVGAEEFERVRHDLEGAKADEKLARLQLSYTNVRAPFAGAVVKRSVEVGHSVAPSAPLFDLADLKPLLAKVYVPSKAFKRLARAQPVALTLDSNAAQLTGRIKLVSPVIDPASGTIKVTIEIPEYPPSTRPGDFAHVRITTERHDDAIIAPRIAIIQDGRDRVVYVVKGDRAQRRVVEVGFEHEGQAEIISGLAEGEKVIVKGQNSLQDGGLIKILEVDA